MKIVFLTFLLTLTHALGFDLLSTISELESKKRDLSILKSEISANYEFALTYVVESESVKLLEDVKGLVKKQEAILDSFQLLEQKLDFIELKACFLELQDLDLETRRFNSREENLARVLSGSLNSKNLNRFFEFFIAEKLEQAKILKNSLSLSELSIAKNFEIEHLELIKQRTINEVRVKSREDIKLKVTVDINHFLSVFESLYRLHKLSETLRQNFVAKSQ